MQHSVFVCDIVSVLLCVCLNKQMYLIASKGITSVMASRPRLLPQCWETLGSLRKDRCAFSLLSAVSQLCGRVLVFPVQLQIFIWRHQSVPVIQDFCPPFHLSQHIS